MIDTAKDILEIMARSPMFLFFPRWGHHNQPVSPKLIPHPNTGIPIAVAGYHELLGGIEVEGSAARELIDSGYITELTEEGKCQRLGWRELGIPEDAAAGYHIFVCTQ